MTYPHSIPVVRLVREGRTSKQHDEIRSPKDVVPVLQSMIGTATEERFIAIHLNTRHRPIAYHEVSRGSLSASIVHPREVFRTAIVNGASAILIGHNHPSGETTPSEDDLTITTRLVKVGELVGIPVLDHLIIGDGEPYSFRENGLI